MVIRDSLKQSHLCAGLSEDELDEIASIITVKKLVIDEILFLEGDEANGFFLLLDGSVRIYKASPEGREHSLHQISPGQTFGEAAAFSGRKYPANCSALRESRVAFVPVKEFSSLLSKSPNISLKMIASLSGFLREFNLMIENLSLKEVSARLAHFLLIQYNRSGKSTIRLDRTKTELARYLGTVSETLSRNLRKLSELGVIDVKGPEITIRDLNKLSEIATGDKNL